MSALKLKPLHLDGLSAEPESTQTGIKVRLTGSADLHTQEPLRQFLADLHEEMGRCRGRAVDMDFVKLEFMNSSCFKAFLTWISEVHQLDEAARYSVTFISNERLHWQKRSLQALRCFAIDLITVQPFSG